MLPDMACCGKSSTARVAPASGAAPTVVRLRASNAAEEALFRRRYAGWQVARTVIGNGVVLLTFSK